MSKNRWIMIAAGAVLLLVLGAFAFTKTQEDKIAQGVSIGGIDVSGLSREQAVAKLETQIQDVVQTPLVVIYRGERRTLKPAKSKVGVDVPGMVNQAVAQSNDGFFIANAARTVAGSDRNIAIPTEISYSKPAVRRFVRSVHKSFDRAPKDATVTYSATSIGEVDAKPGVAVRSAALTDAIVQRLENPTEPRIVRAPMKTTRAKITKSQLAKKYPTIVLVDRAGFKLRLYKKLKLAKTYKIAVGAAGNDTPTGLYTINDRQVNPTWNVPNSEWAGDLAGKTIPPGPGNPLIARWLGIYNGVGIHGTPDIGSLGSAASHGCIRMDPTDVIALYPLVPMGTPVYIA
ncbi:MAG: L,D-transpeptidase family protein [Thermoleophilaceae bacterium]|nr:L,D-transpeptidase family protein [Thermoleophilaceae bacterium]